MYDPVVVPSWYSEDKDKQQPCFSVMYSTISYTEDTTNTHLCSMSISELGVELRAMGRREMTAKSVLLPSWEKRALPTRGNVLA